LTEIFYDSTHDVLVYNTPAPEKITQYIADARQINGSHVAVPVSLYNIQLLAWIGLPIMPIMEGDYDWPHGPHIPKPLDHQKIMANFMVANPKCFNLSDMGTMKTLSTLWAADYVMEQHPNGACRCLIVCPISIFQRVWGDAIFKNFMGKRTYRVLYGTQDKRLSELSKPADFYITNFDGIAVGSKVVKRKRVEIEYGGFSKELKERTDIKIALVDEASKYRDARTKRHRIARSVIGTRDYLWLLTGTPTPNAPTDAYGLAKLVNNAKGMSFKTFESRTMFPISQFKKVPQRGSDKEVFSLLQPSIRYDIKDVWDGPPLTTQDREIELTKEQDKYMAELKRNLTVIVGSGYEITAANEAAIRSKLIQISCGAIYDHDHKVHYIDSSNRLQELRDVIEQAGRKVLIFASLTSVVNLLYSEMSKDYSCAVINGAVKSKDRDEIIRQFQGEENPRLLIADPGAIAHGNDLYAATAVVWYSPTDKTEEYIQGNKRAHRPGQKYPVTVVQFWSNKIEREIFRRLEGNESLQGVVLDLIRG
jgi:SNF2 family DNA or RNA helicase